VSRSFVCMHCQVWWWWKERGLRCIVDGLLMNNTNKTEYNKYYPKGDDLTWLGMTWLDWGWFDLAGDDLWWLWLDRGWLDLTWLGMTWLDLTGDDLTCMHCQVWWWWKEWGLRCRIDGLLMNNTNKPEYNKNYPKGGDLTWLGMTWLDWGWLDWTSLGMTWLDLTGDDLTWLACTVKCGGGERSEDSGAELMDF